MTDSGEIFGGFDDFLCYIAADPKSAIVEIYSNTSFEEIYKDAILAAALIAVILPPTNFLKC